MWTAWGWTGRVCRGPAGRTARGVQEDPEPGCCPAAPRAVRRRDGAAGSRCAAGGVGARELEVLRVPAQWQGLSHDRRGHTDSATCQGETEARRPVVAPGPRPERPTPARALRTGTVSAPWFRAFVSAEARPGGGLGSRREAPRPRRARLSPEQALLGSGNPDGFGSSWGWGHYRRQ
jgi:hypothetical protein